MDGCSGVGDSGGVAALFRGVCRCVLVADGVLVRGYGNVVPYIATLYMVSLRVRMRKSTTAQR